MNVKALRYLKTMNTDQYLLSRLTYQNKKKYIRRWIFSLKNYQTRKLVVLVYLTVHKGLKNTLYRCPKNDLFVMKTYKEGIK